MFIKKQAVALSGLGRLCSAITQQPKSVAQKAKKAQGKAGRLISWLLH
jgi:hypothetical protein